MNLVSLMSKKWGSYQSWWKFIVYGGDNIDYFFKFLIPQLLEYFHNDTDIIDEFIPKIINEYYKKALLESNQNSNTFNDKNS